VLLLVGLTGCAGFRRAVGIPNTWRVIEGGHPAIEAQAREHLTALLATGVMRGRRLVFNGDVMIRTVPAVRKDRLGVPFYASGPETRDRSGGLTLFTGRKRPLVIVIAVLPDGSCDQRTLKHECCHAILLWNGITGHPPAFRSIAPLWY
jgi:hypothetical protein